eukprot:3020132-Lingulodinium_polyedra.AAC.1
MAPGPPPLSADVLFQFAPKPPPESGEPVSDWIDTVDLKVLVDCASQKVFCVVMRQLQGRDVSVHVRLNAPAR